MNEKEILDLWDTTRRTPHDPKRVLDLWDTTRTDNYQLQQMRNRQRIQKLALIPLASGVASIVLGIGLVGSAYAEEINLDPILNVKPEVNQQPQVSIPAVDRTVPKQDSENVLPSPKEPKIDLDFGQDNSSQDAKPKHRHHQDHQNSSGQQSPEPNVKIDPQPDSQDQPDTSQPAQPQKQLLPPVAPASPEPNTNLSSVQTPKSVQQQPNLPKMDDRKTNFPQKVANSKPTTVSVGTDSEPHTLVTTGPTQTKDTSVVQLAASENQVVEPVQKTKDGVSLPKTATPYGNLFLAGFSFLLGGWLLQLSRKMRKYA
ncbi:hypothetical protein [Thermoactinomyces sp. CICC 10521]|uniref:hypothetical protein n=1 Tax=Thermoactinomyces sp. CICC 10521 TaxID=2767426 RepID=UPI0018DE1E32|nr:hypothetical protein [Thermoactinomyces sp. CICC 10521]MBH8608941.1 hypothetical protein [Thermoactinomyces sp. CICC 10521]